MKIVLINLPLAIDSDKSVSQETRFFPEGLASIAASLITVGHDVRVVDLARQSKKRLDRFTTTEVFGLSVMINQFRTLERLIPRLREISPQAKIILGGPLISSDPRLMGRYLDFDFGIVGEGESTIVELLKTLDRPDTVPGAVICQRGKIMVSEPRRVAPLENFTIPAFKLFDLSWYLGGKRRPHFNNKEGVLNNFMISRGCPFGCQFCYHLFGQRVRYKTPAQIENEIRIWCQAGAKFIRFQDDNFTLLSQERRTWVLRLLKKFNLKWSCQGRIDTVDRGKLRMMKEAGLETIYYGVESLSDNALKQSGKDINAKKIREAFEMTLELGIKAAAFLIVGLPGETTESLHKMVEFVKHYKIPVTPYILCPLPGTDLFNYAKQAGKIKNELEFLRQCQNWEENQLSEGRMYVNLTDLPEALLLKTYSNLLECGSTI